MENTIEYRRKKEEMDATKQIYSYLIGIVIAFEIDDLFFL